MERTWSNNFCHSFIQQTIMKPPPCARLSPGDKDESGMAPTLEKPTVTPQVACWEHFLTEATRAWEDHSSSEKSGGNTEDAVSGRR